MWALQLLHLIRSQPNIQYCFISMKIHSNELEFILFNFIQVTVTLLFLWIGFSPCMVGCNLLSVAESKDETSPSEREITSNNNGRLTNLQKLQSAGDIGESSNNFNEAVRNIRIDTQDPSVNSNKSIFSVSLSERKRWKIYYLLITSLVLFSCIGCCALCCKDRKSSSLQESTEMSTAVPLVEEPPQQNQEQLGGAGVDVDCGGNSPLIIRSSAAAETVPAQEMSLNLEILGTSYPVNDCDIADN